MKKTLLVCLILFPLFAVADEGTKDFDISARLINFVIFVGIAFYLLAKPLKNAFAKRSLEIATRLDNIAQKLKETKDKKMLAMNKLKDAEFSAKDIIETSHKEVAIIKRKIEDDLQKEAQNLTKNYEIQKDYEKRKMIKQEVLNLIDKMFDEKNFKLNQDDLVNALLKKVS